jgi:hypothetical protein
MSPGASAGRSLICGSPDTVRHHSRRGSRCSRTARTATRARSPGCGGRWAGRTGRRAAAPAPRGWPPVWASGFRRPRRAADIRARGRARGVRTARRLDGHARPGRGARPLRGARRPLPAGPAGAPAPCTSTWATPTTACASRRRGATSGCRRSAGPCSSTGHRSAAPTSVRPRRWSSTASPGRTTGCAPPPCPAHRILTTGPPRCSSTGPCNRGTRHGRRWRARGRRSAARHRRRTRVRHRPRLPRAAPRRVGPRTGWVVDVRDPAVLLRRLDRYEGPEYRRIRVSATPDRRAANRLLDVRVGADQGSLTLLPHGWTGVIEVSQHETPVTVGAP